MSGLSINQQSKFLDLYSCKKQSMSAFEIVELWNRFIKKPNNHIIIKVLKEIH